MPDTAYAFASGLFIGIGLTFGIASLIVRRVRRPITIIYPLDWSKNDRRNHPPDYRQDDELRRDREARTRRNAR